MRSNRTTTLIAVLLALALAACVPAAAGANPLLSGYGGPGQGDQAILGAALLNGPGEGGGNSGGGGSESAPTSLEAPSKASSSATKSARPRSHHARAAHPKASPGAPGTTSATPANGRGTPLLNTSAAGGSGGTLGLSGGDLLYILLALAGLAMTALLTRLLVRGPHQDGGQLKG
jgi:hypothetical protein